MYARVLSQYLRRVKVSQSQLARELGVSRFYISNILAGRRLPGRKMIEKIIELTGYCPVCGLPVQ